MFVNIYLSSSVFYHDPGIRSVFYHDPGIRSVFYHDPGIRSVFYHDPGIRSVFYHDPGIRSVFYHDPGIRSMILGSGQLTTKKEVIFVSWTNNKASLHNTGSFISHKCKINADTYLVWHSRDGFINGSSWLMLRKTITRPLQWCVSSSLRQMAQRRALSESSDWLLWNR